MTGDNLMNCALCKYREQIVGREGEVGTPQAGHHHHVRGGGHSHSHEHGHDHSARARAQPFARPLMHTYLRDPAAIYRLSFRMAREETDLSGLPPRAAGLALRLVHACGRPEIVRDLVLSAGVVECAEAALAGGAPVIADTRMTAEGIIGREAVCAIDDPPVAEAARAGRQDAGDGRDGRAGRPFRGRRCRRSAMPRRRCSGCLSSWPRARRRRSRFWGFRSGFVGAAESKAALIESGLAAYRAQGPVRRQRAGRGGRQCAAPSIRDRAVTPWLTVLGIGEDGLDPAGRAIVESAEFLVGGKRHLALADRRDRRSG